MLQSWKKNRAFDLGCLARKQIHHKLRPEVQPLTLLYNIFHETLCEKGTPFVHLLLTNGAPS